MKPDEKYNKICPTCEEEFNANHMSRVYCCEGCKREMARSVKQAIREKLSDERLALKENDHKLGELYRQKKSHYTKLDLDAIQFDTTCYYKHYQVDNTIEYVLDKFLLRELPERIFKIYKNI